MATIEELLRENEEVREAELDALDHLNGHMAEIAAGLPRGSLLARRLALIVRSFEQTIEWEGKCGRPGDVAGNEFHHLLNDTREDHAEQDGQE